MSQGQPITVTLGGEQELLDRHLASGDYESTSEVLRAALRALEREEQAINQVMREGIKASFDDDAPDIPAEDVFRELRELHLKRWGKMPDGV